MTGDIQIRISNDVMNAFATIKEGNEDITVGYVTDKLHEAGVTSGLLQENIENLVASGMRNVEVVVAEGKKPGETKQGYFEYFFEIPDKNQKTSIDENGKVHYGKQRAMATTGTKLVEYHPAISGAFGHTVMSTVIAPTPAKNLVMKCGKGVEKRDDSYFATQNGEILLEENRITVANVLVIDGNAKYGVDSETDFVGDIHVKGDVLSGVSIKANGSIEIDGTVEACTITAGKDVIIHGGILGDQKALIQAKGSITCPFVESATLEAEEAINADYVMKSKLISNGVIVISGRRGTIIGGTATARKEIVVKEAGNDIGVLTRFKIDNPEIYSLQYSKIIIQRKANENVQFYFNDIHLKERILENQEYHCVGEVIEHCDIGKFVPKKLMLEKPKAEKKTILLVDDEPIILKTFFGFLMEEYDILLANSAKDAKAILESRPKAPDLILLDFQMPVMDGAQFLESIRKAAWKSYANVPVIFVTALSDKKTLAKCLTLYPQGYMVKPLGKDELLKAVHNYFASAETTEAV